MSHSGDPQNIYDDPDFFAGYSTLERFGAGLERAMEHADLLALLPAVDERRVLDFGCGAGQLARHLATSGAAEVVGVTFRSGCWPWPEPNGLIRASPTAAPRSRRWRSPRPASIWS